MKKTSNLRKQAQKHGMKMVPLSEPTASIPAFSALAPTDDTVTEISRNTFAASMFHPFKTNNSAKFDAALKQIYIDSRTKAKN